MFKPRKALTKGFSFLLVFVLLLVGLPIASASAASVETVHIVKGKSYTYEPSTPGVVSYDFRCNGVIGFCLDPDMQAPPTGNYSNVTTTTNENLLKAMYYGYGGAGFNTKLSGIGMTMKQYMNSLRTTEWGVVLLSAKGDELHYLLTHRALAYLIGDSDWDEDMYQPWREAIVKVANAMKAAPSVKNRISGYIVNTGASYQRIISYTTNIKLQMKKVSGNPELTDGNSCYSLKGAMYYIYSNKNTANTVSKYDILETIQKVSSSSPYYEGYVVVDVSGFGEAKLKGGKEGLFDSSKTYYATEVQASKGYIRDREVYEFKSTGATSGGLPVYKLYDPETKKFEVLEKPKNDPVVIALQKVNARTGKADERLAGAEYAIEYYDGFYTKAQLDGKTPTRRWVVCTDKYGFAYLDSDHLSNDADQSPFYVIKEYPNPVLPLGTVKIYETKAPEGFKLSNEVYVSQLKEIDSGVGISEFNYPTFEEEEIPGKVKIVKTSDDGNVSGIEFIVKNNDTGEEVRLKTSDDGTITEEFYEGSYTITEVTDESKYYPQEPQIVSVKADQTAEVKFHNKLVTKGLTIRKTSTDGEISGINFTIKNNATGTTITRATDKNGYITVDGLSIGETYTVTEIVPDGYEPQQPQTITITSGSNYLRFRNVRETGNLLIKKESSDGKLKGFSFTVKHVDDSGRVLEWLTPQWGVETDENGEIKFDNIPTGNYEITEVDDWYMYYTNPEPTKTVKVTKNETGTYTRVSFKNELIVKPVKIIKTSPDGNVEGITFKITGYYGDSQVMETREFVTDKDGVISYEIPASTWGDEYIVEEVVPDGYEKQESQSFYIDSDTEGTTVLTFNNIPKPDIKVVKTSDDGMIEGIEFTITYTDPETGLTVTDSDVTDENGTIIFDSVYSNIEYTIEEIVPDGYEQQQSQTVTPQPGEVAEVKFHNVPLIDLKIVKSSGDGIIENVWFEIFANDSSIGKYSTNELGEINLGNLAAYSNGELITYRVEELGFLNDDGTYSIPDRYIPPAAQSKTLAPNENTIEFFFENAINYGDIRFVKADSDGTPLSNVRFTLFTDEDCTTRAYDVDGNLVTTKTSDDNGVVEFTRIKFGTYYIAETKAQSGYQLLGMPIKAVVSAEGTKLYFNDMEITNIAEAIIDGGSAQLASVGNNKTPEFPRAGGIERIIWFTVGAAVIILGAALLFINIKRKRKDVPEMTKNFSGKKFLSLFMVLAILLSMGCVGIVSASAVNPYHIDSSQVGSIEFYKYEMSDVSEATTKGDGTAKAIPDGATPLEGVEFTAYQIADLEGLYTYAGKELPTPTEAGNMINDVPASKTFSAVSDENGYLKLKGLPLGIYLVKETFSPSQVSLKTASFVVSVPTTSPNGTSWMYDITVQPKNETKYADITLHKTDVDSGADLGGFSFVLEEKIVTSENSDGTWTAVGTSGSTGTTGGTTPAGATWTTGENGKFTIAHLATDRSYRFKEVSAEDKQYIVDSTVYYEFTVGADGTVTYDSDNFKDTTPAANNTLEVTNETVEVEKSVSTDKTNWMQDVTQDINKTVYWKVSADIPEVISKLKTYTIIDTLSKGLTYESLEIKVEADGNPISENDYTVTTAPGDDDSTVITVDITNKNTLAGHEVCDVIITTTLNEDAIIGGDNPNEAKLVYTNDVDTDSTYEKITEKPEVHTGGYSWFKSDNSGTPLSGAEFSVYRTMEDAKANTNPIKFVLGEDGKYYMSEASNASATVVSGFNGMTTILGLKYGENGMESADGETTYYVAETKAPDGKNLLAAPFEIKVNSTSHNYVDGVNVNDVNTDKADFPNAGSNAAAAFLFVGAAVIALGAAVFFIRKRKCAAK